MASSDVRKGANHDDDGTGVLVFMGLLFLLCLFAGVNDSITNARLTVETHTDSLFMVIFSSSAGLILGLFVFFPLLGAFFKTSGG
jgi:hypothetical protein